MKAVVQRVVRASVTIDGTVVGKIDKGVLILVCAMQGDTEAQATQLATKISKLRIFKDDDGNSAAAPPAIGEQLYENFKSALGNLDVPVQCGEFGADMAVELVNDGPVTILYDL